ncbi:MAG: hypothetical protein RMY28_019635 [Nostoc sp. ChiSLP01]|nr:hypothetical protein [Nostoc sp. ChiSLP01]
MRISRREKFERRLPPFAFGVAAGIKTSPKGDATRTVGAKLCFGVWV